MNSITPQPDDEDEHTDDRLPWEIVRPSCWLRDPWFRAKGWVAAVTTIIKEGRQARGLEHKPLTQVQVAQLEHILAKYIKTRVDWDGFLNKGDRDALKRVRHAADMLLKALGAKALEAIEESSGARDGSRSDESLGARDGSRRPLRWYLEQLLTEEGSSLELDRLEKLLRTLVDADIRSPRLEEETGRSVASPLPPAKWARAVLQEDVDFWWRSTTGLSVAQKAYKAPAFVHFLEEVFSRIKLSNPPGWAEGAIAEARREIRAKRQAYEERQASWARKTGSPLSG